MDGEKLQCVETLKYLGIQFNRKLDMNADAIERFKTVTKSFFSLNSFGLKPLGLNPYLQSFIYKTFCLSKFLYGLEIMTLNNETLARINVSQNSIVRYIVGLYKKTHISPVLKALKLFNINALYLFFKMTFIKNLKKNFICKYIFDFLMKNTNAYCRNTNSFVRDIRGLIEYFNCDIQYLYTYVIEFIKDFKREAREMDEEDTTIMLVRDCLHNSESYEFIQILNRTLFFI